MVYTFTANSPVATKWHSAVREYVSNSGLVTMERKEVGRIQDEGSEHIYGSTLSSIVSSIEPHGTSSSCMRRLASPRGKVHRLGRIIRCTVALPQLARRTEQQVWSDAYQKAGDIAKPGSFADQITCEKSRVIMSCEKSQVLS